MKSRHRASRFPRAATAVAGAALAGLVLAGCGSGQSGTPIATAAASSEPAQLPPVPQARAASGTSPAAPADLTPAETPPPVTESLPRTSAPAKDPSATRTSAPATARQPAPSAGLPPMIEPSQGGTYWGAVVAYSPDGEDLTITQALQTVHDLGYPLGSSASTGCYPGVDKLLTRHDPQFQRQIDPRVVVALFATETDAKRFEQLVGDILGVVKVQHYCLD